MFKKINVYSRPYRVLEVLVQFQKSGKNLPLNHPCMVLEIIKKQGMVLQTTFIAALKWAKKHFEKSTWSKIHVYRRLCRSQKSLKNSHLQLSLYGLRYLKNTRLESSCDGPKNLSKNPDLQSFSMVLEIFKNSCFKSPLLCPGNL